MVIKKDTYRIETYGCASNKADSLIISQVLNKAGYQKVNLEEANFLIINTCGVKQQTENKIKRRLWELQEKYKNEINKHVIITGCLPFIAPNYLEIVKNLIPKFSAIIDLDNIHEIALVLEQIKAGKSNIILRSSEKIDKGQFLIDFPSNKITGILPISEGCLGNCTYCCVKNARGRLKCYNPKSLIKSAEYQLKQGIKQLYLTSQDCSTYEYQGTTLKDLTSQISNLNFEFFLRLGMLNPRFLLDHFNQLISILEMEKVYQFLHVPIQSGSNVILKKMQRTYRINPILEKLEILRIKLPFLTISTDIICGFPGESEHHFYKTINIIKWLRPEILNISKYTPRPGTKAKGMKQVDSKIIKDRSKRLTSVYRVLLEDLNEKWKDWHGKMLCLYYNESENYTFGRNFAYKDIILPDIKKGPGEFLTVKIDEVKGYKLIGKIKE